MVRGGFYYTKEESLVLICNKNKSLRLFILMISMFQENESFKIMRNVKFFATVATFLKKNANFTEGRVKSKKKQFLKALDGKLWPGGLKKDWLLLRHKIDTFLSLRLGAP